MHGEVLPRPLRRGRDYWLCRCESSGVDAPEGRVGTVGELRFGARADRPDALAVRTGLLVWRLLIVPVAEVAEIVPDEGRVCLIRARGSVAPGRLGRLRVRLPLPRG